MELILDDDTTDFSAYMRDTENEQRVKPVAHWEADLVAEFAQDGSANMAPRLPWGKLADKFQVRAGEVSLWFGFNGHGKSLLLGQAMMSLAAQGERVCIASFEMRPRKTLARMCRQFVDASEPTPAEVRGMVRWAQGRLWVYDQTGTVDPEKVFAVIRYCADRLKVTQFVVDNLTKCVASDDDYAGQKAIVDKLTSLAQALNIHIHLVHHARKDRDESRPPRKMDALGASAITNLVDNVLIVWRNKAKYEAEHVDHSKPDACLIVDKQRHGSGWEGLLSLAYHQRSLQYLDYGNEAMALATYPHGFAHREAA